MRRVWTTLDIELINSGVYTAEELSEVFEVPAENIRKIGTSYRKVRKSWDKKEVEELLQMIEKRYPKSQICKTLDRSIHSVNNKLRELDKASYRKWSKKEIKFLEDNYKTMVYQEIAKRLKRSEVSIRKKMFHLRKKKELEFKINPGNPNFGRELVFVAKKH